MRRFTRWSLAVALALALLCGSAREAAAHANYERSEPAANAIVEIAPGEVRVWFTEEPEPGFSELQIYDASGRRIQQGSTTPVSGEPRALRIAAAGLAPGTYTVVWKVLSSVDGHITRGVFPFTVGLDQVPAPMVIPAGVDAAGTAPSPWSVVSRWLTPLTAALLAGAFLFLPLVLGGALRALAGGGGDTTLLATAWGAGRRRGLLVSAAAAGAALIAGVLALLTQAAVAAGVEPWQVFGAPLATLLGTRYALIWAGRMLLIAALGALALYLRRPGTSSTDRAWWLGLVLAGALLWLGSLNSHAAAVPEWTAVAVLMDWTHLVATAIWIGGLAQLALALPAAAETLPAPLRSRLVAAAVPRFSRWALAAVGLLLITGLYQTWLHVGSMDALTATAYGQALLAKLALLLPLLVLAGINLVVVSPRVGSAVSRGTRAALDRASALERVLRGTVGAEVALGVLILAVVGLLTSLAPARDALRAQGVSRTVQAQDVRAVLRVAPGEAGLNTFDVALSESGRPLADAERVLLRAAHVEHEMGVSEQPLQPAGDGHYRAMSGLLSMAGRWDLQLLIRRAGQEDVQATLQLDAADPGAARAQPGTPYAAGGEPPTRLLLGALVLALGVLLLIEALRPVRRRRRAATMLLGGVAASVGLALQIAAALYPSGGDVVIPNPVPATAASIGRGAELYQQQCLVCHGVAGRGDGPLARNLNPRPADLRTHTAQHTDGQLWLWITDGFPGSAMPAFRTVLSEEDRWHLVNYLRAQFGAAASVSQR